MESVVTTDPKTLGGTPCFAGTRVPVKSLFDYLEGGHTIDYFLRQFPRVKRAQVSAILDRSCRNAEHEAITAATR